MAIYRVAYTWYETDHYTLVEGPEKEDWKAFCKNLLEVAAKRCVDHKGNHPKHFKKGDEGIWIGCGEIIDELIFVLKEHGYKKFEPESFELFGSGIITNIKDGEEASDYGSMGLEGYGISSEVMNAIVKHNLDLDNEEASDLEDDE